MTLAAARMLAESLYPVLAAALLCGMALGLLGWSGRPMRMAGRIALFAAAILLVLALAGAAAGLVPGRAGLRLEAAIALALAYLGGCGVGALLRRCAARLLARRRDASAMS